MVNGFIVLFRELYFENRHFIQINSKNMYFKYNEVTFDFDFAGLKHNSLVHILITKSSRPVWARRPVSSPTSPLSNA